MIERETAYFRPSLFFAPFLRFHAEGVQNFFAVVLWQGYIINP